MHDIDRAMFETEMEQQGYGEQEYGHAQEAASGHSVIRSRRCEWRKCTESGFDDPPTGVRTVPNQVSSFAARTKY